MDMTLYNDTYDLFCQMMKMRNPKILEIGCGPGNITRYLLTQRPDFEIEAIDIAPNMIARAKKNNPAAHFKVMDCRNINSLPSKFDAIVCGFCMPYLSREDCEKLIQDCAFLLNPEGIFYLSFIEDDYSKSKYETSSNGEHTLFVYYHRSEYLMETLKKDDFEVLEVKRKDYPKPDGITSTHTIFISRKSTQREA